MSGNYVVMEKIKKLLRLGRRSNHEGEASTALMMAQQLAAKHGLKIDEINDADVTQRIVQERGETRRVSFERRRVWEILEEHFGVKLLFNSYYGCVYVGPEVNIAIAQHVEVFLMREVARAWKGYKERRIRELLADDIGGGIARDIINDEKAGFVVGFFHEIHQKLTANPLRNDRENEALKDAIKVYVKEVIKPSVKASAPQKELDEESWHQGCGAGSEINLSRPMEGAAAVRMIG